MVKCLYFFKQNNSFSLKFVYSSFSIYLQSVDLKTNNLCIKQKQHSKKYIAN